jgi:catechol 2,3-dioxygenase-like lactoylglutathione lyase family enzyme
MASFLSQLILDVQDIRRSIEFYSGLLCLPVRQEDSYEGHHLAYLDTGSAEILLIQQPPEEQMTRLDRCGGLVINFRVENLDDIRLVFHDHEVEVLRGIEDGGYGERTMLVSDPDGYAVLLSETTSSISAA